MRCESALWVRGILRVDENGKTTKVGDPYAQIDPNADVIPSPDDYDEQ
jgi:hypothetical protein